MAIVLSEKARDILRIHHLTVFSTINRDGTPQLTTVMYALDDDGTIAMNVERNGQKAQNMRRDPRVAIALQDPANPYRYLEVRGRVVEITEKDADDHINKLSQKYLGKPVYPFRQPGEVRVIYKIEPEKASSMG